MRLLIIEDNKELADSMRAGLEKAGFQADVSYMGNEGEELAFINNYDAILLDLNLPDNVIVENVHLSESLMQLSYNISRYNEEHQK